MLQISNHSLFVIYDPKTVFYDDAQPIKRNFIFNLDSRVIGLSEIYISELQKSVKFAVYVIPDDKLCVIIKRNAD